MTLRRQLFWGMCFIFFLIFLGVTIQSIQSSREYLRQQLASHAQDAATTLSHNLADAIARNDRGLADAQVASFFDRGYFQRILIVSPQGTVLVSRNLPPVVEGVPLWFSDLVKIPTAPGESLVSSGWRQLGRVVVVSQPTFAYQHLWRSTRQVAILMLGAFLVSALLTHYFLKLILNPLGRIEKAAEDICEKRFIPIAPIPRAQELKRVVLAMNDASQRISGMLEAETRRADGFRKDLYHDELTGLNNRRGFDMRLQQAIQDEMASEEQVLMVVELDGLKDLNVSEGHPAGDRLLKNIADKLMKQVPNAYCARIGGTSFGLICSRPEFDAFDAAQKEFFPALFPDTGDLVQVQIGATPIQPGDTQGQALARADLAIEMSRQAGGNCLKTVLDTGTPFIGSSNWRTLIDQALSLGNWSFFGQTVLRLEDQRPLHVEIFSRLRDTEGRELPATHVIPMAHRHCFMPRMDRTLIDDILNSYLAYPELKCGIAINLSLPAVEDDEFMEWLGVRLTNLPKSGPRLSFELSELGCLKAPKAAARLRSMLHAHGAKLGIDQFGLAANSTSLIKDLAPDYIKLEGALVLELAEKSDTPLMLAGLLQVTRALDVEVIAMRVENETTLQRLRDLGVEGGQGYLLGKPTLLPAA